MSSSRRLPFDRSKFDNISAQPKEGQVNPLINLMANIRHHIRHRRHNDYVTITYTPPEDELYPMVLKHGHVTVEREDTIEYPDATGIINADRSLTITRGGNIIGWHDADTYWRAAVE